MRKIVINSLCLVLLAWFAAVAMAGELIDERAYFSDPSGQMNLQQVEKQAFITFEDVLNLGYTKNVTWVRLKIQEPKDVFRIILRVRPNYLDDIQLFSRDDQIPDLHLKVGDRFPRSISNYAGKDQGFWVRPIKPESIYYLRVKTTSTSIIFPEALTAGDMKEVEAIENLAFGFYLGLMTWILLWAISVYFLRSEGVIAGFIGYQVFSILIAISFMGYLAELLPKGASADLITTNLILLATISAFFFHKNYLGQYSLKKIEVIALNFFFVGPIINWVIGNFFDTLWALKANAISVVIGSFVITCISIRVNLQRENRNYFVLFIYLALAIVMVITQLMGIGVIQAVELLINASLLNGLLAGILLYLMMYVRSSQQEVSRLAEQTQALLTAKKLENETHLREAQSAFIALLIHELKSPIAVVKLGIASMVRKLGNSIDSVQSNLDRLETAADDMNVIIERCIEVQKVDTGSIPVHKKMVDLSKIIWALVRAKDRDNRIELPKQDTLVIQADEELVKVVLLNLLENALKYAIPESKIQIFIRTEEAKVIVTFQNQVDSIAMPVEAKVFQKFYRAEESKRHRGSGLGLWLSKEMSELIGGQLNYRAVGNTVIFEFFIPYE